MTKAKINVEKFSRSDRYADGIAVNARILFSFHYTESELLVDLGDSCISFYLCNDAPSDSRV